MAFLFPLVLELCQRYQPNFFFSVYWTAICLSFFAILVLYFWLEFLKTDPWELVTAKLVSQLCWGLGLWGLVTVGTWLFKGNVNTNHLLLALVCGFFLPVMVPLFTTQVTSVLKPLTNNAQAESLKINIFGSELTLNLNNPQRQALWHIFNELVTRIATVKLYETELDEETNEVKKYDAGVLREALTSIYSIFAIAREQLKGMPPTPKGTNPLEALITLVLNEHLRPFLARWHPRLTEWEKYTGMPEHLWPLNRICRDDLEHTRQNVFAIVTEMAKALELPEETTLAILGEEKEVAKPLPLFPIKELVAMEQSLRPIASSERVDVGWQVMLECVAFAKIAVPKSQSAFKSRSGELQRLGRLIRLALKKMQPTPATLSSADDPCNQDDHTVEMIALQLLASLQQHLDNWQAAEDWQAHLDDLAKVEQAITEAGRKLGKLLGVRQSHTLFK